MTDDPFTVTPEKAREAANLLGVRLTDLAVILREAAAEQFKSVGAEFARGHEVDLAEGHALAAAAEAADEAWEQENPGEDDEDSS